jgi:uncharacterized DUF497 family protein
VWQGEIDLMLVTEVVWLEQFAEKIGRKHRVSKEEVEEVFEQQPPVRRMRRGARKGEDLYRAVGDTDAGRYLAIFFIYKGQGRGLVISARDADNKELKGYGKRKK